MAETCRSSDKLIANTLYNKWVINIAALGDMCILYMNVSEVILNSSSGNGLLAVQKSQWAVL